MKNVFCRSGTTADNKPVVQGSYSLYETHGIPLSIVFLSLMDKECVPDWIDVYLTCENRGMIHERIIAQLSEAILDSFGSEWEKVVIANLEYFYKSRKINDDT